MTLSDKFHDIPVQSMLITKSYDSVDYLSKPIWWHEDIHKKYFIVYYAKYYITSHL